MATRILILAKFTAYIYLVYEAQHDTQHSLTLGV